MRILAHHAGEEGLAPLLLLLGGGGLSLAAAIGRARLATARSWLERRVRQRTRPRAAPRSRVGR